MSAETKNIGGPDAPLPIVPQLSAEEAEHIKQAQREAMERLNQKQRILTESIMLPKTELTEEQIKTVVTRLNEYLEARGLTITQVAKEVGVSKSVLSEWGSGKYIGDCARVCRLVNNWIERDARRHKATRPSDFVSTWIAECIRTYAYLADKRQMMSAIVAPSGSGKTKVLKALTEEMRGVYVYCTDRMSARDLYYAIAAALGWHSQSGSRSQLQRFIVEKLAGTKRIILIDEAHNCGRNIGALRSIHDQAEVPIVMCGTAEILDHVNDRSHGRGQFSSRTIRFNAIQTVANVEGPDGGQSGRDLFTIEEIKQFFVMQNIRLTGDALRMFWALACLRDHGALRLVKNITQTIFDSESQESVITRDQVITALQSLMGTEAGYLHKMAIQHADKRRPATVAAMAG